MLSEQGGFVWIGSLDVVKKDIGSSHYERVIGIVFDAAVFTARVCLAVALHRAHGGGFGGRCGAALGWPLASLASMGLE